MKINWLINGQGSSLLLFFIVSNFKFAWLPHKPYDNNHPIFTKLSQHQFNSLNCSPVQKSLIDHSQQSIGVNHLICTWNFLTVLLAVFWQYKSNVLSESTSFLTQGNSGGKSYDQNSSQLAKKKVFNRHFIVTLSIFYIPVGHCISDALQNKNPMMGSCVGSHHCKQISWSFLVLKYNLKFYE